MTELFSSLCIQYFIIIFYYVTADTSTEEIQLLNELPLQKLLKLKSSLQNVAEIEYNNTTVTDPTLIESFGAQAMAMRAPIKRTEYEDSLYKKESVSKISNIFSMSVTTLAFLAFGGYLLCLIVQAVKSKHSYNPATVPQSTFLLNAGIKKPQSQFASYGRRKRDTTNISEIDLPPEELFAALVHLCEGYVQWSK